MPLAGMSPPVNVTLETPTVAKPPQVLLALPEINVPAGNVSVSGAVRLAMVPFALLNVMVSVESPPIMMVAGLKALPSIGETFTGGMTVKVAMAAAALLPLLVWSAPAATELM